MSDMSGDNIDPQWPAPEEPGGRLSGPDAGWRNMLRNLDGAQAIAAAEDAAHGHHHAPGPGVSEDTENIPPITEEGPTDDRP